MAVVPRAVVFGALFVIGFALGFHATQRTQPGRPPTAVRIAATPTPSPSPPPSTPASPVRSPAPAPRAATGPVATDGYRVQVGAFRSRPNADALAAALQREGFAASVIPGAWFRVVLGPYASRDLARHAAAQLQRRGYPAIVVPSR